jgi:hypothetical protein
MGLFLYVAETGNTPRNPCAARGFGFFDQKFDGEWARARYSREGSSEPGNPSGDWVSGLSPCGNFDGESDGEY